MQTDKSEIEANLQDYASKLEAVLNTVIDGIITINQFGIIQSFNRSAERIFGYQADEVIGQNVKVLMPDPYFSGHDGYLKNYLATGDKKVIGIGREVKAKRKNGKIFSMELAVNEIASSAEKMFVGTIRDISDRKQAEQALSDNQATLQAIVDNTIDGIITIDHRGTVEHYNKACERIFGFESNEVIGKNVKMLMPAPYHNEHDGYLDNYQQSGTKKIIGIGREVEGQRKNGSTFPLDLSVSEVNVQGRKLYSGIVRDISERKKAEAEIKQANAELEEFAYRTSHDLRSPLVSCIRLLDLVEESIRTGQTERALTSTGFIQSSLKKLEELVKDILLLTKVKNAEEARIKVDVNQLVMESLKKFQHMANFERLDIQYAFTEENELLVQKSRLGLIIENLISNAVKYQDLHKENSYIKISTFIKGPCFVVEITDNGLGIPENQHENLFKMFKRFHPKTSFGSGLGLYMMKKSTDMLNGKIEFTDGSDTTKFSLYLPRT